MASGEARYGPLADQIARRHGLDPKLFRRLITAESGWNPNAVSGAGARGLTQVVPKWHPKANLSTPQGQLEYGASHLSSLIKKYGNPRDALAVYNSGKPWSVSKNYGETNNYVNKILGGYSGAGVASGAAPGVPPAPGAPGAADIQQVAGSLDAKRLMMLLNNQRARSLRGLMPAPGFQRELAKVVQGALPRAQVAAAGANVGAQAAQAGQAVTSAIGGLTMGGGPSAHHSRALGNWQSDDAYDLMGKAGQPIYAGIGGVVTKISGQPGGSPGFAGYGITVRTPQGDLFYKHIGKTNLKRGMKIKPGQLIGTLDPSTAGGPHLHLGGTNRALLDRLAKAYTA
jgi:murein DD-endopeptidase MepM/ murein hydrolase activator NlpD